MEEECRNWNSNEIKQKWRVVSTAPWFSTWLTMATLQLSGWTKNMTWTPEMLLEPFAKLPQLKHQEKKKTHRFRCFPVTLFNKTLIAVLITGQSIGANCISGRSKGRKKLSGIRGIQLAKVDLTAATIDLALMPNMSSSSWGLPLWGTRLTASRWTTMPGSSPTAAKTASPRPPAHKAGHYKHD